VEHALNLLIATLLLGQIILILAIVTNFRRKIGQLELTVRSFVTPKGPDEASPLANVVDVGSDMVARAIMARAKTTFMGQLSGQVRQEKAVEGAIAEDVARNAHPLAGTLLDAMPELRKTLRKNPQLLDFALSKLGGMMEQKDVVKTFTSTPNTNNGARKGGING